MSVAQEDIGPDMLREAQALAALGLRVIPLHTPIAGTDGVVRCSCRRPECYVRADGTGGEHANSVGKHPRLGAWGLKATADAEQIAQWWEMWPGSNVGIVCGLPRGAQSGLVVIDVDPRNGGTETIERLFEELGALPPTAQVISGSGGPHYYLRCNEALPSTKLGAGVDVQAGGGDVFAQVVAPPSLHKNGRRYAWELSSDPTEGVPIAELPDAWRERIRTNNQKRMREGVAGLDADSKIVEGNGGKDGPGRKQTLISRGRSMWAGGFSRAEITAALTTMNAERCEPSLPVDELRRVLEFVFRVTPGRSKERRLHAVSSTPEQEHATPEQSEAVPPDDGWNDAPLPPEPVSAVREGNLARGDAPELGTLLLTVVRGTSTADPVYDGNQLYRYDDATGVWSPIEELELRRTVATFAGTPAGLPPKPLKLSDSAIKGAVAASFAASYRKNFFADERPGVAFENGFATVEGNSVVLLPHAPEHRARYRMPYAFDAEARADRWISFFEEVWRDFSEDDRAKRIAMLEEWIGAALLGIGTTYQRSLILVGDAGANGKSTLLSVVRELFPREAVRASGPQQWSNLFYLAELSGARINIVNELPDAEVEAGETFKAVISGDEVTAARKHRDPFSFCPRASHVFACNVLPGTRDQSGGFWRRQALLTFPRTFAESEQDRTIGEQLRRELPAIAARVLRAATRLVQRGHFEMPESSEQALEEWREDSDQVRQWVRECCDVDTAAESTLASIYQNYAAWSKAHGHKALASNKLGGRLKMLGYWHRLNHGRYYKLRVKASATASYRTGA